MEDMGTTYKLIDRSNVIAYCLIQKYYYQRQDSILHQKNEQFMIDRYILGKERFEFISSHYPQVNNNYTIYAKLLLDSFPYIDIKDKQYAQNIIK